MAESGRGTLEIAEDVAGFEFTKRLLDSRDFSAESLRELLRGVEDLERGGLTGTKRALVDRVAQLVEDGELGMRDLFRTACYQPRDWLAIRKGTHSKLPAMKNPSELMVGIGDTGWYGPFPAQEDKHGGEPVWYVYILKIRHHPKLTEAMAANDDDDQDDADDQRPIDQDDRDTPESPAIYMRWMVFVELHPKYVALSWNGFTVRESDESRTPDQFPFWKHIDRLWLQLGHEVGGDWADLDLFGMVFDELWPRAMDRPGYHWHHKKVRARGFGCNINASVSSSVSEFKGQDLRSLSRMLTNACLGGIKKEFSTDDHVDGERGLLLAWMRKIGTLSYEFELKPYPEDPSLEHQRKVREEQGDIEDSVQCVLQYPFWAHIFFGRRPLDLGGKDAVQYLQCRSAYDGTRGVLRFLTDYFDLAEKA